MEGWVPLTIERADALECGLGVHSFEEEGSGQESQSVAPPYIGRNLDKNSFGGRWLRERRL